jgi:hypothetical protein
MPDSRRSSRRLSHPRAALAGLSILAVVLLPGTPVAADAAGPGDYESEVVSIDPATPSIVVEIVGGDSFVSMTVDLGTDAVVLGYAGEEYLWFRADGDVLENQNSPATYLNTSRYGGSELPGSTDAAAAPDWKQIASGGVWAWHDHRAHWMLSSRPAGFEPGDQILDDVIPVIVDGESVEIGVTSTWLPEPSLLPVVLGAVLGLVLAAGSLLLRRSSRGERVPPTVATIPAALVALVAGVWQYTSLPAATGPRPIWWVLPAIACLCALVATVVGRSGHRFASDALLLVTGVELMVWGFVKRDGLTAAVIPTGAPGWFDRLATATALVGGVGFALVALWSLFSVSASRAPTGSPLPAHP